MRFPVEESFEADVRPLIEAMQSGCCGDPDLLLRFLRDLWTLEEGKRFSQRWRIARLLMDGMTSKQVIEQTGATHVLVRAVSKFATGSNRTGGYEDVYRAIHEGRDHKKNGTAS